MQAGFRRGAVDTVLMRCLDILLAFPALVLALAVAAYPGQSDPGRHRGLVHIHHHSSKVRRARQHRV